MLIPTPKTSDALRTEYTMRPRSSTNADLIHILEMYISTLAHNNSLLGQTAPNTSQSQAPAPLSTNTHLLSTSLLPTLFATNSNVLLIAAPLLPGNFFFRTSIKPTLLRLLPSISFLKSFMSSGGTSFFGLDEACAAALDDGKTVDGGMAAEFVDDWGCIGKAGLGFRRSEADAKNCLIGLAVLEGPLTVKELDFNALRGRRGGSIVASAGGAGSQYLAEKGSIAFIV
jgi:hypothetical protein